MQFFPWKFPTLQKNTFHKNYLSVYLKTDISRPPGLRLQAINRDLLPKLSVFKNFWLSFWSFQFISTRLLWKYVIDNSCIFHLTKNWIKKPFLYQELLKLYVILDFKIASNRGIYIQRCHEICWCQQKFFKYFESIHYGLYNNEVSWL